MGYETRHSHLRHPSDPGDDYVQAYPFLGPTRSIDRPSGGSMKRSTKTMRLAAVGAAGALVLAACGGGDDDGGGEDEAQVAKGDGVLTVGSLLPSTGDLAFLGPPEFAGVDLAVQDINEAGGVLGKDSVPSKADSGDGTPKIAPGSVDKLLNAKVDTIIGAASSSVSLSVIDKIISAGVVHFSPAENTSTEFDTYDDKGMYFRTAPSDVLQGNVLGNLVLQDGAKSVAIMARQDSYGEALAENTEKTIKDQGGNVAAKVVYSVDATSYTSEVAEDQGRQARCHRADRVQRDHEDHPGARVCRHRSSGHPDLLRRRQHRRLQQGSGSPASGRDPLFLDTRPVREFAHEIDTVMRFGSPDYDGWEARAIDLAQNRNLRRARRGRERAYGPDVTRDARVGRVPNR